MKVSTTFPAHQAFSYLAEKQNRNSKWIWIKHGFTLLGLLIIILGSIGIQFPKSWVMNHLTTQPIPLLIFHGLFLACKAFLAVEAILYISHRYIEHLGFSSRHFAIARQNQQFHWTHHMIIYPLNHQYERGNKYIPVDRKGVPWHWVLPVIFTGVITIGLLGFCLETFVLFILMAAYAKWVDFMHSLFHLKNHFLKKNRYFQWLHFIHILHHFDQQKNFTITTPLMDILFGTYLAPNKRFQFIKSWLENHQLNASDFINWHYLLTEATPTEYAVKIAAARQYKGVAKKAASMAQLLKQFEPSDLFYGEAQVLLHKMMEFLYYVQNHVHYPLNQR